MDESDSEPARSSARLVQPIFLAVLLLAPTALAQSAGPGTATAEPRSIAVSLAIVLALVLVNGLFAMAETAILTVRRTRIEQLVDEGSRPAALIAKMLSEPTRTLSTIQVGITFISLFTAGAAADSAVEPLARWIGSVASGPLGQRLAGPMAFVLVIASVSFVTLVLGEIAPKSLAVQRAEPIALLAAYPLRAVQATMSPVVALVTRAADVLVRPFGGKAAFHSSAPTAEELKIMVEQSEEYGVIEPQEKEMIHSIFDLGDTTVRKVMTPRLDVTAVSADALVANLVDAVQKSGHSRLPVYDEDLDRIVGIVHVKDVLDELAKGGNVPVRSLMRPPFFIPENKRVDDLLADFRKNKLQIAVVRDEYGTVTGVVTIEDLIEEITGEIQDEYDLEDPEFVQMDPLTAVVDARMNLEDFGARMGVEFPLDEADTLGGFVFGLMGHQPMPSEEITWDGLSFRIEQTDGRRIQKLRVARVPGQPDEPEDRTPASSGDTEESAR